MMYSRWSLDSKRVSVFPFLADRQRWVISFLVTRRALVRRPSDLHAYEKVIGEQVSQQQILINRVRERPIKVLTASDPKP